MWAILETYTSFTCFPRMFHNLLIVLKNFGGEHDTNNKTI